MPNERIQTYVDGLDDALNGGLEKGRIILVSGTPGTMKSSTILYIMKQNNEKHNAKCLYLTLEERKDSLHTTMEQLGMGEPNPDTFSIVDIAKLRDEKESIEHKKDWFVIMEKFIHRRKEEEGIDILAIDSLNAIYTLTDIPNPRIQIFHFFEFLRRLGITTFLISEMDEDQQSYGEHKEDFLADGTIILHNAVLPDTSVQLRMRVVKMRHVNHYKGHLALMHRNGKLMVAPVVSE